MIPARFDYEVAGSVEHAVELLAEDADAKLLAGGHSLVPALKLRLARPSKLVDIGRLSELSYVRDGGSHIAIGSLTRLKDVRDASVLGEHCPIVSHTAGLIGDPQVRHRGTIGGTIAYGDPASDMPTVALALGADMVVRGEAGERVIPAGSFFTGVFQTALSPTEVLVEIRVPKLDPAGGWAYLKAHRRAQDWATVGVAAVRSAHGTAVALTHMGATPLRAAGVEEALAGGASAADAAAHAADGTSPPSDHAGSAEYRSHLATVLCRRALEAVV